MTELPLILDGATGTALLSAGMPAGACTERFVMDHPEVLQAIQMGYREAGSRVLYASTFGANRMKLTQNRIPETPRECNALLTAITRTAAGECLVAGDMAPTGGFVRPYGDLDFAALVDVYTEQAAALEAAGVDLFVIETMMTMADARAALLAVRSCSEKPVFVTFTCGENGRTLTGTDVRAALVTMQAMGADAFGLNCSTGPDTMLGHIRLLTPYARIPLIAKPNAGLPQTVDGKTVYHCPPEEFVRAVPELAAAGVRLFGGCCGTDAGHIAALRQAVCNVDFSALPEPVREAGRFVSNEKMPQCIPEEPECSEVFACDEDLADNLMDAEEDIVRIRLEAEEELDNWVEASISAQGIVSLEAEDETLLEQALRVYQGVAVSPADHHSAAFEQTMTDRYGTVFLSLA